MRDKLRRTIDNIGTKIILPYFLLTMAVAAVGAFVVTNLVASSLDERINNQLLDAGRVISEIMVEFERERLSALRVVAGTEGITEAIESSNPNAIDLLVPQILSSHNVDALIIVNADGNEIYSWLEGQSTRFGADFATIEDVKLVLNNWSDNLGDKRAFVAQLTNGYVLLTIGPVIRQSEIVGAVMVGTEINNLVENLTQNAIGRVTIYDNSGEVLATSLSTDPVVLEQLKETPEIVQNVAKLAEEGTNVRQVDILNQTYRMIYGDWRLRNQSFGMFSVSLPTNFIINAASTSRDRLGLLFSLATVGVFLMGFVIARRIVNPINRLVQTSSAVSQGDLSQRTGISRQDEIGVLASAFDEMTFNLAERNRQLVEKASELEAILNSIADGLLVVDANNQIISSNPAANQIINDIKHDIETRKNSQVTSDEEPHVHFGIEGHSHPEKSLESWFANLARLQEPTRYQIGTRVFSALASPVETPDNKHLGKVIVMRDITRDVEAEQRQNNFITSVSHELRTPLTSIKGYVELMLANDGNTLDENQKMFASVIQRNTNQMIEHVEKLLDIAELQAGTIQFRKDPLSLNQLTGDIVKDWREKIANKGVVLKVEISDTDLVVLADEKRLGWAIDNILRNAYSYTLSGGNVLVRVYPQDGQACVSVQDSGVGIHQTDLPYVFKKFFRAEHHLTMDVPGLGLELFITRAIVEGHNGKVWVESEIGVGSVFGFSIPLVGG